MSHHTNRQKPAYESYRKLLGLPPKADLPDLFLLANAEDERTGQASEVYAFKKPAGRYGIITVPREAAFEPGQLRRAIIAMNGLLPRESDEAVENVKQASNLEPREYRLHAAVDGWQPGGRGFCHRGQIIGGGTKVGLRRMAPLSDKNRQYALLRRGNLRHWKKVAKAAEFSSRMRMALCAAFAAPLLKVINLQSFSVILAGKSKTGKSTALLASGSVIGIGLEGGLPNFNATIPAMQEIAIEFNDRVMPVNEIGLIKGSKKEAYLVLRPLTYRFSEGRDTSRHSRSSFSVDGAVREWRSIMLASSENTIEALAHLAGEKRDEGEWARAFDVPATSAGHATIFDRYPTAVKAEDRDQWARKELINVRQWCSAHHGLAFEIYVKHLVEHKPTLAAQVRSAMADFLSSVDSEQLSGALQHAARNFALFYAGGVLAVDAKVVSWNKLNLMSAIRTCFQAGLDEIQQTAAIEQRAQTTLMKCLKELQPRAAAKHHSKVDGWYEQANGKKTFFVQTAAFERWFERPQDRRTAIRFLHDRGLLILRDNAEPKFPNIGWAITFKKIGEKGHRGYQFQDPASETQG